MVVKITQSPIPLESGDRLSRDEFERRYEEMAKNIKAELLQGVVYMASAVRFVQHGGPQSSLVGWIAYYKARTSGIKPMGHGALSHL